MDELQWKAPELRYQSQFLQEIQANEIARLRQSLREARELIEEMGWGGVSKKTKDAARTWLEENGDART